jgi:hypothetical protein
MTRSALPLPVLFSLVCAFAAISSPSQETAPPRPAVPVEPITAILDAFRTHSVVALDEGSHGNEQAHVLRLSLIRNPKFADAVNADL